MKDFSFSVVQKKDKTGWIVFPAAERHSTRIECTDAAHVMRVLRTYVTTNAPRNPRMRHEIYLRDTNVEKNMLPIVTCNYDPMFDAVVVARVKYAEILPYIEPHIYMMEGMR